MAHLIITRGLPGSGKSTIAREIVSTLPDSMEISLDDLRFELFGASKADGIRLDRKQEGEVHRTQRQRVSEALKAGKTVVVHDTCLPDRRLNMWSDVARKHACSLKVIDLRGLPIEICIQRDAARDVGVGENVIRMMAQGLP